MPGVYVHLPFCPYICPYCDFAKWPYRGSRARTYLQALLSEIGAHPKTEAETVFLGGGTPNGYEAADVAELLAHVQRRFPGDAGRESTVEINPDAVRDGDFEVYRSAGVTRLSIGVQSFAIPELRTLGRRHTSRDVAQVVAKARAARVPSVSLDLMFAVPGQTARSWRKSLAAAIALDVDHISAYGLTIEAGTPFAAWRDREPGAFAGESLEAELYAIAIDALESAGFEQYEISNFARSGHRCRHNENYWANGEYVGVGVSAASYRNGTRSAHTRHLEEYIAAALDGRPIPGESECLEGARRAGEAVMLALRTAQGVSFAGFKERYGLDFLAYYAPIVRRCREDGSLATDATHARLTRRGRFVANDVCAAFVTFS